MEKQNKENNEEINYIPHSHQNNTNAYLEKIVNDNVTELTLITNYSKCIFPKPKLNSLVIKNLFKIFMEKRTKQSIINFLDQKSATTLKRCINKKFNIKEKRKIILDRIKNYVLEFGKNHELVKFRITEDNRLFLTTNIFNISTQLIKSLLKIEYNKEFLSLEKKDLYQFLKLMNKQYFDLRYKKIKIKVCKSLVPFDTINEDIEEEYGENFNNSKKYEQFYNDLNIEDMTDFSVEALQERQKKFLEKIEGLKVEDEFFPLKFISTVNYWCIMLCQGGYFSVGFFHKDKLIEHKSDHKYVVRKKAGKRQVVKDNSKMSKNSMGAQLRRDGEKKHQENIECILKINEDLLSRCDALFVYAPGLNKSILVGNNEKTLFSYKKKIINIPFSISRANFSHMMDIYTKLTTVVLEEENFEN